MTLNASGSLPARTRLYSAGVTRRLVRSPAAPKIVIVAGGAWRREPDAATVDEGVGAMVFASLILLPVIDAVWRLGAGSLGGLSTTQAAPGARLWARGRVRSEGVLSWAILDAPHWQLEPNATSPSRAGGRGARGAKLGNRLLLPRVCLA